MYSHVNSSRRRCSGSSTKCHVSATYFRALKSGRRRQIRLFYLVWFPRHYFPTRFTPSPICCNTCFFFYLLFSFPFSIIEQIQSSTFFRSSSARSLIHPRRTETYLFPRDDTGRLCDVKLCPYNLSYALPIPFAPLFLFTFPP